MESAMRAKSSLEESLIVIILNIPGREFKERNGRIINKRE